MNLKKAKAFVLNNLKILFLSIAIGLFACAISIFAFSSPGANQPPNGNPIFWLLSGTSMYYTAGNVGIGTNSPTATLDVGGTGSQKMPVGTTAQRPSGPVAGMMRFNTDINNLEVYNGTKWLIFFGGCSAVGGTITQVNGYCVHTFTASGTFIPTTSGTVEYLVVAGGGSGNTRGGGGGGGVLSGSSFAVTSGSSITVTVGAGGNGTQGSNSVFGSTTAIGGGLGAVHNTAGSSGGSGGGGGGGGGSGNPGGSGTTGQGYAGGNGLTNSSSYTAGGGGGGAGGVGGNAGANSAGDGGIGLSSSVTGVATYYGGGGGGRTDAYGHEGVGGLGGGGTANDTGAPNGAGNPGTNGLGGGGSANAVGGSGIVIVRYPL